MSKKKRNPEKPAPPVSTKSTEATSKPEAKPTQDKDMGFKLSATETETTDASDTSSSIGPVSPMSKYLSFALLLAVILIFVFFFYEVMAKFLIPLFLAALLVVIFRPMHAWILKKCGGRETLGAGLTTAGVLLLVLVPISVLLIMAAAEGRDAFKQFNTAQIYDGIKKIRTNLKLDMPTSVQVIESELAAAQQNMALNSAQEDQHQQLLYDVHEAAKQIAQEKGLPWPVENQTDDELPTDEEEDAKGEPAQTNWEQFASEIQTARRTHATMTWTPGETEKESIARNEQLLQYQMQLNKAANHFSDFRPRMLGGKTKAAMIELVNPSEDDTTMYIEKGISFFQDNLIGLSKTGVSFLGNLAIGTAIMIISLYFFLLDGPKMIESLKGLSPIDDRHEEELVSEFGRVSRAVVIATLLSALVQGLLAGVGFYFAGLESIFLLTVLSAVLAMIPFVGAAAVWIPCSLYLYFIDNNMTAAIVLAVYGAAVISMADNVIKPFVLHGQSNLHPLLALLSVIGGVAALGPIGILIGPMVVAFLQTLLKILQREMRDFDRMSQASRT